MHGDRDALRAKGFTAGCANGAETTHQRRAAVGAVSLRIKSVADDVVPVAHDQGRATAGALRAAAVDVVHISGVHVLQPRLARDAPRPAQGGGRGRCDVAHLEIRMKGAEMQGCVITERVSHPA